MMVTVGVAHLTKSRCPSRLLMS